MDYFKNKTLDCSMIRVLYSVRMSAYGLLFSYLSLINLTAAKLHFRTKGVLIITTQVILFQMNNPILISYIYILLCCSITFCDL